MRFQVVASKAVPESHRSRRAGGEYADLFSRIRVLKPGQALKVQVTKNQRTYLSKLVKSKAVRMVTRTEGKVLYAYFTRR